MSINGDLANKGRDTKQSDLGVAIPVDKMAMAVTPINNTPCEIYLPVN
jgi:hypothetical protein